MVAVRAYREAQLEDDLRCAMDGEDWPVVERLARELDGMMQAQVTPPLLGAALWYAERGVPVFPLHPGDKRPYDGSRGVLDATTDTARVREWWTAAPDSNIGLATGYRFDAFDFDGADAHAAWGRYAEEDPDLSPDSWAGCGLTVLASVSTPRSGGLHVYVPPTGRGNYAGLVPGVDFRGLGGYVVAPPSRTELGTYRFLRPMTEL